MNRFINLIILSLSFVLAFAEEQEIVVYPYSNGKEDTPPPPPPPKRIGSPVINVSLQNKILEIANRNGQAIQVMILGSDGNVIVNCVTYDGKVNLSDLLPNSGYEIRLMIEGIWWYGTFIMN